MPWNCILTLHRQLWKISCQQLFCRGWRISSDLLRTSPFAWFGMWKQLLLTRVLLLYDWALLRKEFCVNKVPYTLLLCLFFSSDFFCLFVFVIVWGFLRVFLFGRELFFLDRGWKGEFYLTVHFCFSPHCFCLANEKVEDINGCPRSQSQMVRIKYIFSLCWHLCTFLKYFSIMIYLNCEYSVPRLPWSSNSHIVFFVLFLPHVLSVCHFISVLADFGSWGNSAAKFNNF